MLTDEEKYKAFVDMDTALDGVLYIANKSTGTFCRTICTSKKSNRENSKFYVTIHDAMSAGYCACKICTPMEALVEIPDEILSLIHEVETQTGFKIQEWQLRERGIDPNSLRRWFQKNYEMSFQAYCRMHRINENFGAVNNDCEFDELYYKNLQLQQGKNNKKLKEVLVYKRFDAQLGPMIAIASRTGLCLLEFGDRRMLESELKDLEKRLNAVILPGSNNHIEQAISQIQEYFGGQRKTFTVALHTPGTEFQNDVWTMLQAIPYGKARSYSELAKQLKNPNAVRAVGHANGMNRIAIIIPCHRVVGANGALTGYGGGLWRKEWLLRHEVEEYKEL